MTGDLMLSLVIILGLSVQVKAFISPTTSSTATTTANQKRERSFVFGGSTDDDDATTSSSGGSVNVLGTQLSPCCTNVRGTGIGTGFYRNGFCSTGEQDTGRHTVCVQVTDAFLEFSKSVGNDLSTPAPQYHFPGLQDGDIWCLCAQRWVQALQANKAPRVYLRSTHEKTLSYIDYEHLRLHAIDGTEADQALDELNQQRASLKKLL